LVSIVPLFLITCGFYILGKKKLTEHTKHTLEIQSNNVKVTINNYFDSKFEHLYRIANIPQFVRALDNKVVEPDVFTEVIYELLAKLNIDPDFLSLTIMDVDGNVVLSISDIVNYDFGTRPLFYEAIKGKRYVSAPSLDDKVSSVYFSIPLTNEDKIIGVLVAQCNAEELWELVEKEDERIGSGNTVIISDPDGVRIAHSKKRELIFKSWMPLRPEIKERILKEKRFGRDIKEILFTEMPEMLQAVTATTPVKYLEHNLVIGKETYYSVINVMDNGWRVISSITKSTFLEPVRYAIFYMGVFTGIIICVVTVASSIIGRFGTRRLKTFASISNEIADGNYEKKVPFINGDEIGQLGRAFNIMTASVKRKIEQLKYINDVAIEIHSHIELERLLQNIVNISKQIVGAEMGGLFLIDKESKKIKDFKVSMPDSPEKCTVKDKPEGKGLLGIVLKQGSIIRIDDVSKEPLFSGLPPGHVQVHTLLGIPIIINNNIVGGMFVANKNSGETFKLEDEEILLTIVHQATIAIENATIYEEAHKLATTDSLTGLLNHREFRRRLEENIEGSKRYHYKVSLLMIDIDHFKEFNDTYGHQVGDRILKTIGSILMSHVRVIDTCARYGGEEFVVILKETEALGAVIVAERIHSSVNAYIFEHDGIKSKLSVSIGAASFPGDASDMEELIKKADMAMYLAKRTGRNKVCSYKDTLTINT
ncbi:MAG TPA: diguanylate cyclase, partial [Candidatus Wujingus californicus]|uniref:diguanylate cyclase n=1 Tax=Candidatus Wujingus californicus TaxID=3367618 RepID=UPI004028E6C0